MSAKAQVNFVSCRCRWKIVDTRLYGSFYMLSGGALPKTKFGAQVGALARSQIGEMGN